MKQTAFRLSDDLIARVRSHAKRMSRNDEGITFTMTDALKALLTESLKRHEAGQGGEGAPRGNGGGE